MDRKELLEQLEKQLKEQNDKLDSDYYDDESHMDEYIELYGNGEDEDGVPVGCQACGGPYPMCADSCPMFDD